MAEKEIVLDVRNLKQYFHNGVGKNKVVVKAVDDVSFKIAKGQTFGLVGESGCGKTTTGRTVIRLYKPTSGEIYFNGKLISGKLNKEDSRMVHQGIQMIFQDPISSLDPRMTIKEIIGEGLIINKAVKNEKELYERVLKMIKLVGLSEDHLSRYPHEFSGGQQQRVGIARALAVKPEFIVCDEPISALDVSIQSQVVNMLEDMQAEMGLTYLFIAHDLSVVRHISNRIGVMYLGSLVELGESYELNRHPIHPYTQTLLSAVPVPDPKLSRTRKRIILEGDVPSPMNPPSGCRFHTRCPYATQKCREEMPQFKEHEPGHWAACHLLDK